jgi:hypothetical protein
MFEEVRVPAVWTVAHRGYSGNRRLDVWIYRDENTALRAAAELAMSCGVARTTTRRPTKAPGTPPPLSAPTSSAELDTATDADAEAGVWEEGSPSGSAAPVVKRGPNADRGSGWISRSHPPGGIPTATSSSTTSASADGTPSFEGKTANTWSWTPPASTEPISTANRSNRRNLVRTNTNDPIDHRLPECTAAGRPARSLP